MGPGRAEMIELATAGSAVARHVTNGFTRSVYKCSVAIPHDVVGWFAVCDCVFFFDHTHLFFYWPMGRQYHDLYDVHGG